MEAHIQGFTGKHYCPRMATMNKPCYAALREHASGRPALIFVASRRQTRLTALDLIALAAQDDDTQSWVGTGDDLDSIAKSCHDPALRHCLPFGVGVHHGGLNESDRKVVENLFERGAIQVLVCTSTLAWGVNFPARLVIVKGTEFFDGKFGRYVDFPVTDVLQMMGRAGRPQFDSVGVACIFVHQPKKEFYKKFLYEPFPVESRLLSSLHNFVCAEVCLTGRINSVEDGVEWLKWTYLYRRLRRNPSFYECEGSDDKTIQAFLETLARRVLVELDEAGVVELDGDEVASATLGSVAAYYYLDYRTTSEASINVDDFEADVIDASSRRREALAVAFLCAAREFDELPVRHNEDIENSDLASQLLDDGDGDTIDGLLELGYDSPHAKAQLLIHAKLRDGKLPIADYATDQRSVLEQAPRVLAALIDVAADAGCSHLRGNFRRPFTPSTRRWPRNCDSSMAWRFTG
jgi:activating signal cointegrator complex subunit 3